MTNPPRRNPRVGENELTYPQWVEQAYARAVNDALLSCDILREKLVRASKRIGMREASVRTAQDVCDALDDCRVLLDDMNNNQEVMDK